MIKFLKHRYALIYLLTLLFPSFICAETRPQAPITFSISGQGCDPWPEICGDGIDQNCDGSDLLCPGNDKDMDGFSSLVDCVDTNRWIRAGQSVTCKDTCGHGVKTCQADGSFSNCHCNALCEAGPGGNCYYISLLTGSDNNIGTFNQPWKTFRNITSYKNSSFEPQGKVSLKAGDVIYFMSGAYEEVFNYNENINKGLYLNSLNGEPANPITIKAYPSAIVVLSPKIKNIGLQVENSSHIKIENISIVGGTNNGAYQSGLKVLSSNNIELSNLRIFDIAGSSNSDVSCLHLEDSSSIEVHHSLFHDCYSRDETSDKNQNVAIYRGGNINLHHNVIYQTYLTNGACIIYKDAGNDTNANFDVSHNTLWNCADYSIASAAGKAKINHNLILNSAPITLKSFGANAHSHDFDIFNNTIVGGRALDYTPTNQQSPIGELSFRNNIVSNVGGSTENTSSGAIEIGKEENNTIYDETFSHAKLQINDNCYNPETTDFKIDIFSKNYPFSTHSKGAVYNWSNWRNSGFDSASFLTSPQFADSFIPTSQSCSSFGHFAEASDPTPPPTTTTTVSTTTTSTTTTTTIPSSTTTTTTIAPPPPGGGTLEKEPICPGGSNPRSDIVMCLDFENQNNCTTGKERDCFDDNGMTNHLNEMPNFRIVQGGEAAAGGGYLKAEGEYGTTGPGYSQLTIPGGPYDSVTLRYYVKFDKGHMTYLAPHGPGIMGSSPTCSGGVGGTFEISQFNYHMYVTTTCAAGSFDLKPNQASAPVLKNNVWHMVEHHRTIDTHCSNINDPHGCNGVEKISINGQTVIHYTDINFGGVKNGMKFDRVWGPRHYYHVRIPEWEPDVHFDNFAVSNTGQSIGPAQNENSRGTPDPLSPYINYQATEAFFNRHPARGCSSPSAFLRTNFGSRWRDGASLVSSPNHGGFPDQCPTYSPDSSMKVEIPSTSGGGGITWEPWKAHDSSHVFPQQVIKGWIYLPSSNDYSQNPALSGFRRYACGSNCNGAEYGKYVAFTLNNGKYAIVQKDVTFNGNQTIVSTSNENVKYNQWQEFEIILWQDQTVSLMIDRKRVFNKLSLPYSVDWIFENNRSAGLVIGVIDYQGSPSFKVYYDDLNVGTASFWSCDGWHSSSCPFN